jgi:hypothetical protein
MQHLQNRIAESQVKNDLQDRTLRLESKGLLLPKVPSGYVATLRR